MTIALLDPSLVLAEASAGRAYAGAEAFDAIIGKINELVAETLSGGGVIAGGGQIVDTDVQTLLGLKGSDGGLPVGHVGTRQALLVTMGGSYNTAGGSWWNEGIEINCTATRSSGANPLRNVGLYVNASGAQQNYAAIFGSGDVVVDAGVLQVETSFFHNAGLLGFYGTTPIARPTGVAVSAAGIHAALVSLGLIAA